MEKALLWVFGVVFVLVGLLGWVPNPLVGMGGLFETNHAHDLVHLIIGVVFILVALFAAHQASMTLKIIGAVYLLVAVLGFVMAPQGGALLGLIETNTYDHYLHVVLGVVLLAAGFWAPKGMSAPMQQSM